MEFKPRFRDFIPLLILPLYQVHAFKPLRARVKDSAVSSSKAHEGKKGTSLVPFSPAVGRFSNFSCPASSATYGTR